MSSGINNSILIDEVTDMVSKLSRKVATVENNDEMLFQVIADAVQNSEKNRGRREEPKGLHIIESGEALVVSKHYVANLRLSKSDTFGTCNLLKKIGPEYLGDVRAGVKPV